MDAVRSIEGLAMTDNKDAYLRIRPIFDLRCPFTINDLLTARMAEREKTKSGAP